MGQCEHKGSVPPQASLPKPMMIGPDVKPVRACGAPAEHPSTPENARQAVEVGALGSV